MKLAMSPACETSIAYYVRQGVRYFDSGQWLVLLTPRMATSMCPPRIIAKESLESIEQCQRKSRTPLKRNLTENRGTRKKGNCFFASVDEITVHGYERKPV